MSAVAHVDEIESKLRHRVATTRMTGWASLAAGIPLCFVGPLLLATIFWMAVLFGMHKWTPWTWWFGALSLLAIPSLFRLELRSGGRFLEETLADAAPSDSDLMTRLMGVTMIYGAGWGALGAVGANPGVATAGFVEFFLVGPRMVISGVRKIRSARDAAHVNVARAAAVVGFLLARDSGVEPRALLCKGEALAELALVLLWLASQGWIGVLESGDRVFLYSEARRTLTGAET